MIFYKPRSGETIALTSKRICFATTWLGLARDIMQATEISPLRGLKAKSRLPLLLCQILGGRPILLTRGTVFTKWGFSKDALVENILLLEVFILERLALKT